jgi:hypothetical protein
MRLLIAPSLFLLLTACAPNTAYDHHDYDHHNTHTTKTIIVKEKVYVPSTQQVHVVKHYDSKPTPKPLVINNSTTTFIKQTKAAPVEVRTEKATPKPLAFNKATVTSPRPIEVNKSTTKISPKPLTFNGVSTTKPSSPRPLSFNKTSSSRSK